MPNISDIMSDQCYTVTSQTNIYDVALLMKEHDIGFVPVVDNHKLIGVVTDRDLVIRGYAGKLSESTPVSKVITNDVRTVSPDVSVDEAAMIMASGQIRRLPVVKNGELMGVLSLGDLAVRQIYVNEAGDALSEISEHGHQESLYQH